MGLRINTNLASLTGQAYIRRSAHDLKESQEKIASGSRLNRAKDDPTALSVAEHLRVAGTALRQNIKNAVDGISYLEITDGALGETTNILIRMRELAMQSATGTYSDREREYVDKEYQALKDEIDRLANTTLRVGQSLLGGEGGNVIVQVGRNHDKYDSVDVTAPHEVTLDRLGISSSVVKTSIAAGDSLVHLDDAITKVAAVRGAIGASESRLHSLIASREEYDRNLSHVKSMIHDTEYAQESVDLARSTILNQAGVALLAQANNVPQLALKLLS